MKSLIVSLAAAVVLLFAGMTVSVVTAGPAAAQTTTGEKITAWKLKAKAQYARAKAALARKAEQAAEASKVAYAKAKAKYEASQTPEAKADRSAKYQYYKLKAQEKYYRAKVVIAEKARQVADASKREYAKMRAAYKKYQAERAAAKQ